jgi:hypothetical protein
MKRPHPALLILTGALFLAWIGYMAYQAFTLPRPNIVLSRPQFLVADLWVIAHIENTDDPTITVKECVYAAEGEEKPADGSKLTVANLADCKKLIRTSKNEIETRDEFTGPGDYIVPLSRRSDGYVVTPMPHVTGLTQYGPHIYPLTPETRARLAEMPHPEKKPKSD